MSTKPSVSLRCSDSWLVETIDFIGNAIPANLIHPIRNIRPCTSTIDSEHIKQSLINYILARQPGYWAKQWLNKNDFPNAISCYIYDLALSSHCVERNKVSVTEQIQVSAYVDVANHLADLIKNGRQS